MQKGYNVERHEVCILIATAAVSIVCGIFVYHSWYAQHWTLPLLRYQTFHDRMLYAQKWHHAKSNMHAATAEYNAPCFPVHYIRLGSFTSYYDAVTYAVHLRETYALACQIVVQDSVSGKNMVPWYTLASVCMPLSACESIIQQIRQDEPEKYVETCRQNKR